MTEIEPQPIPEAWSFEFVPMSDGSQMVLLRIQAINGIHLSFLDGPGAVDLGGKLANAGRQITSGIILPPGVVRQNGHKDTG